MFDKSRKRHAERLGQFADRPLTSAKPRKNGSPRRVGERAEDGIEVIGGRI